MREPWTAEYVLDDVCFRHVGDFDGDAGDGILLHELDGGTVRWHNESMRIHGEQHQPDQRGGPIHYQHLPVDGESRRHAGRNSHKQRGERTWREHQLRASGGDCRMFGDCDV